MHNSKIKQLWDEVSMRFLKSSRKLLREVHFESEFDEFYNRINCPKLCKDLI